MDNRRITLKNVKVHNLKSVSLTLDRQELVVFTGVSGSGKSSLAFDTLYVEGQRRYVESLSSFARGQMGELIKPDLEAATGISPTISIEQKAAGRNPRSTVGTMTEIYDYMRVLYARVSIPHCPVSGEPVTPQSRERIIKTVQSLPQGTKLLILAPYARAKKAEFKEDFQDLLKKGFTRVRIDGKVVSLDEEQSLDGSLAHDVDVVMDRLTVNTENSPRIAESLTQALNYAKGICSILNVDTQEEQLFSMHAYSQKSGLSYESLEPHDFSFNSPSGMCPRCHGLGNAHEFDLEKVINPNLSIAEDCCSVATSYTTVRYKNIYDNLAELYNFSVDTPWKKLPESARKVFLYGTDSSRPIKIHFVHPTKGYTWTDFIVWKGVLYEAHSRYAEAKSERYRQKMGELMNQQICPECKGQRLKPYPAAAELNGKRISELTGMTTSECLHFLEKIKLTPQELVIAEDLLKEIRQRLQFLIEVGLHYLTLDRTAPTLSGGEAQRVRLASQVGGGLVGITYILDEPSIGLHPRDNKHLIGTLKHLRDMGNTVVVVEHDEETMWSADRIVDFGPGPGIRGGEILVNGSLKDLLQNERSITAAYLTGKLSIPIPKKRRKPSKAAIEVIGAAHHNLKEIDVKFPLGIFLAITGVSGSGKSSLISEILYPILSNHFHASLLPVGAYKAIKGMDQIDKVIAIDQSPIGRNPRSNPATYIKLFDDIRDLFSQLPESQARGYKSGRFSFNVKEGRCPHCEGMGMVKIDMDFMEDAWVECSTCHGKRFDQETLSVHYKGKNIYDILEMEVAEALEFFAPIPFIYHKLETLKKVGMEYIKLGQSSTTLSGGEAQRVKLAKELVRPATGQTLYILDEPTTGLHFHDIKHLLEVLHELVERGNTVLVIEHNMDVVKTADWIIDLGPEGGREGGKIVATGTPEQIARMNTPTGHAVKEVLEHDVKAKIAEVMKGPTKAAQKAKEKREEPIQQIIVQGAEQNNLKHLDVEVPRGKITVCTGPSGSGKSSFAFDTVYAEGQRRYIESLSPYARQFVKQMPKPKVGHVEGLSPAIAIEQKMHAGNPRSTVGTLTEIYDYLRILFARLGIPHSPETGEVIKAISKDHVVERVLTYPQGEKLQILAPIEIKKSDTFESLIERFQRHGYLRIRLNGAFYELDQPDIPFDRKRKNELFLVIDRVKVDPSIKNRLLESIDNAATIGNQKVVVVRESGDVPFNLAFAVESTGESFPEVTPKTFAFNTPEGMCPACEGLGYQYGANLTVHEDIMKLSVMDFMRTLWLMHNSDQALDLLFTVLQAEKIDPTCPMEDLTPKQIQLLFQGSPEDKWYTIKPGVKFLWMGGQPGFKFRWKGIHAVLTNAIRSNQSEIRQAAALLLDTTECIACKGARLNPLARNVTIHDTAIHQLCHMPIQQALDFVDQLKLNKQDTKLLGEVKDQLLSRLRFLCEVGLDYLSLDRSAPTLSGGETQRIRLGRQLGSGLTEVLYVLDEPTIGLHPRDNDRLNGALKRLKDLGNTLLLVEHDPLTVAQADYVLDFGPQSGLHGGYIVAKGTVAQIKKNPRSLTGAYLSGKKRIEIPKKRRKPKTQAITIQKASLHNLKDVSVRFPLGIMTVLTGVSGSGKSTLMNDLLLPAVEKGLLSRVDAINIAGANIKGIQHFDRMISIDQNPIGHTVRSDVGTYVEILDRMRTFFAALPAAKIKGLQPKHFSYNHRAGMCTGCQGLGYRRVEMHFLPPIKVTCSDCQGMRLNPVSLEVLFDGKNFGQYLDSTVDEIRKAFENHPRITRVADTLIAVGLGYLKIGQEMASLSGGEAQRIKLSGELSKRSTGNTLYLMDEPTTGLHSDDIAKLLHVLHQLVDKGNTMIIIEHNLDIIKNADYLIDLGPEAGDKGGYIVCEGTPEVVAKHRTSHTAKYLNDEL